MAKKIFKYIGLAVLAGVVWAIVDSIIRFGAKGTILVTLFPILFPLALYDSGSEDLGGGYTYYDCRFISGNDKRPWMRIPQFVEDYEYNSRFIVASQRPTVRGNLSEEIEYIYPLGRDTTYYWIIDKDNDRIYGPVLYSRFRQLGDSLDIRLKMARPDGKLTLSERLSNIFLYPHGERIPLY